MKEKFVKYLKKIEIPKALHPRIGDIYKFYKDFYGAKSLTDIFISEYIKDDGKRELENLWFFTNKFLLESKMFINKDDFDATPLKDRVLYWGIKKQDYDFKKATEKSRLTIQLSLEGDIIGTLKSSGVNCDELKKVFEKHIVPNLKV